MDGMDGMDGMDSRRPLVHTQRRNCVLAQIPVFAQNEVVTLIYVGCVGTIRGGVVHGSIKVIEF